MKSERRRDLPERTFVFATRVVKLCRSLSQRSLVSRTLAPQLLRSATSIGANIQEIDVNIGATYTMEQFSFTLAHGWWIYAGDEERIIDFVFAYADGDTITKSEDWSLNPSVVLHWRYDQGAAGGDEGVAGVIGIRPSFTFSKDTKYPISLGVPAITIDGGGQGRGGHSLDEQYNDGANGHLGPQWALLVVSALAGVK